MIPRHFKLAFKKLLKNRFTSLINIAGLSIGIAAFVILMYYVDFEYSFDKFHENADHIYRVESLFLPMETSTDYLATSAFGYGPAMKEEIPEVQEYCRLNLFRNERDVKYNEIVFREEFVVFADSNFFDFFSFELVSGNSKEVLSEPLSVVISELAAKKYFKNEDPIGKLLLISNQNSTQTYTVTGVFVNVPARSHLKFNFLLSYPYQNDFMNTFWYMHDAYTYIRVASPDDLDIIEEKFIRMSEKYKTRPALKEKTWAIYLVPLQDIHMQASKHYELEQKGNRSPVKFLGVISIIIIVIAWVNYINIATTQGLERVKELMIFRIHGAHFKDVLKMILAESTLVNLLAFLFSIGFILISIPLVERFLSGYIFDGFWSHKSVWTLLALSLLLGIAITGIIPALLLFRNEKKSLRGKNLQDGGHQKLRDALILFQFMVSVVLIVITLVVQKQNNHLRKIDLGMDIEQTLVVKIPTMTEDFIQNLQSLKQEWQGHAFANYVTASSSIPGRRVLNMLSNYLPSDLVQKNNLHEVLRVDEDYIPAYELKLLAGRNFTGNRDANNTSLIINETSGELYGFNSAEEAIGREVILEGIPDDPFTVIGVLEDFHHMSAKELFTPINLINSNYHQWIGDNYYSVKLQPGDTKKHVEAIQKTYNKYFQGTSFNYFFLDDSFNAQYEADIKFGRIFKVFTLLGIFIVCLGLIGLTNYIMLRKTKEIGIRKVNGAGNYDIIYLVNKGFIQKLVLAFVMGSPLAYVGLLRWLEAFAVQTTIPWWLFVISGLGVLMITVFTVTVQSWKKANNNPAIALRDE